MVFTDRTGGTLPPQQAAGCSHGQGWHLLQRHTALQGTALRACGSPPFFYTLSDQVMGTASKLPKCLGFCTWSDYSSVQLKTVPTMLREGHTLHPISDVLQCQSDHHGTFLSFWGTSKYKALWRAVVTLLLVFWQWLTWVIVVLLLAFSRRLTWASVALLLVFSQWLTAPLLHYCYGWCFHGDWPEPVLHYCYCFHSDWPAPL